MDNPMKAPWRRLLAVAPKSDHHQKQMDASFFTGLERFLDDEVLPQVTIDYERVSGSIRASYDEPSYLRPTSLVKDKYRLKVTFHKGELFDKLDVTLRYKRDSATFTYTSKKPPTLDTYGIRNVREQNRNRIRKFVREMMRGQEDSRDCPICGKAVGVLTSPFSTELRCTTDCFIYHHKIDPQTGKTKQSHLGIFRDLQVE